jgi:hypothetical protein
MLKFCTLEKVLMFIFDILDQAKDAESIMEGIQVIFHAETDRIIY